MESVITRVVVNAGSEPEWEAVMRDRMAAAESSSGWIGRRIFPPEGGAKPRLIVGLWETRDAWKRWHEDSAFHDTAERLKGLESYAGTPAWHAVTYAGGRFHA